MIGDPRSPSPDEARSWYRRELLDPAYHETNPVERVLDWVQRLLVRSLDAAASVPVLGQLAAMAVGILLVAALVWLASRTGRTATVRSVGGPVLTDEQVAAAELRARAEAARDQGRYAEAVVEGFRALALRQVERGAVVDQPGATAREVAAALELAHPRHRGSIAAAAALFDLVLYGERPATPEQASSVLELDDRLTGARR